MNDRTELFAQICIDLGLENTPDWGIINADAKRVVEFIQYSYRNLPKSIQYEFVELIFASMDEAIEEDLCDYYLIVEFIDYVIHVIQEEYFSSRLEYWISLASKEDFPVASLIERLYHLNARVD